jgi:hypothetical protein
VATDRDSPEPEVKRVDDGPGDPDAGDELGQGAEDGEFEDFDAFDDFAGEAEAESPSPAPGKMEAWRKRSATGAVLTGLALGFQQVFEKEREEPAIIMTTSGDPPRDLPVEAEVEHGRPRRSVVNIRPWLLDQARSRPESEHAAGSATDRTDGDRPTTGSPPEGD